TRAGDQLLEQASAEAGAAGTGDDGDRHDVADLAAVVETRVTGDADIVLREQVLPTRPPGELAPPRGEAPGLRPEELGLEAGDLLEVLPAHLPQGRRHVGGHCSSRPPGASRRGGCCWRGATRVDFGTAGSAVSGRR